MWHVAGDVSLSGSVPIAGVNPVAQIDEPLHVWRDAICSAGSWWKYPVLVCVIEGGARHVSHGFLLLADASLESTPRQCPDSHKATLRGASHF